MDVFGGIEEEGPVQKRHRLTSDSFLLTLAQDYETAQVVVGEEDKSELKALAR